jgi:hypothetical protein
LRYAIDTSSLLDGYVRLYAPDVFPSVWTHIDGLITAGHLRAPEEVLVELAKKDDKAHAWAKKRKTTLFIPLDASIQLAVTEILKEHPTLVKAQKIQSAADPFVIALAKIEQCAVVTAERLSGSLKKPKMPDVCQSMGIKCVADIEMLRESGFVK